MTYRLAPITGKAALAWIADVHRHLPRLQGALFAVAVEQDGRVVGVATAGNPARVWMGTGRIVVTRCAVLPDLPGIGRHAAPVCSKLYGALCRASKALGYREAWTYTLPGEDGRSIRAAGFTYQGETEERIDGFDRPSRSRAAPVNGAAKGRWMRRL